jgi:hypothetical protein
MRSPVTIGELFFETKKAATEFYRSIISEMEFDKKYREGSEIYSHLISLLRNHPSEWKRCSVPKWFRKKKNWSSFIIEYRTVDSRTEVLSYTSCINGKSGVNTPVLLSSAMRASVEPSIQRFRDEKRGEGCNICGNTTDISHIDHIKQFSEIRDEFLEMKKGSIPGTFDFKDNRPHFKKTDRRFDSEFREYHDSVATLQKLCIGCHKDVTKSRKYEPV